MFSEVYRVRKKHVPVENFAMRHVYLHHFEVHPKNVFSQSIDFREHGKSNAGESLGGGAVCVCVGGGGFWAYGLSSYTTVDYTGRPKKMSP